MLKVSIPQKSITVVPAPTEVKASGYTFIARITLNQIDSDKSTEDLPHTKVFVPLYKDSLPKIKRFFKANLDPNDSNNACLSLIIRDEKHYMGPLNGEGEFFCLEEFKHIDMSLDKEVNPGKANLLEDSEILDM